jgi:hypothetical protein
MTSAESPRDHRRRAGASGRTRWRRFAILFVPAAAVAATLVTLTAQGVLAASISVSGTAFEVTASRLNATGFEQFGGFVTQAGKGSPSHPVAITALRTATLTNLCQSVSVGGVTMVIKAGGGGTPVSASNMIIDADQQSGNATFHNIIIGQDAGTVTEDPGVTGPAGGFAEQADSATFTDVRQHTWLTTAGTFTLPGFSLSFGAPC